MLMLDENEVPDLNNESDNQGGRADNRFKDLSDKVRTTADERDKAQKAREKAEAEKEAAKKEVEFYKNFSTISSKYQGAADYQDKILEKVNAGYDMEDATISILAKEGKFQAPPPPQIERESPAGGSATTAMSNQGEKTLGEMSRDEKREQLLQWEKESGGLSNVLRRGL